MTKQTDKTKAAAPETPRHMAFPPLNEAEADRRFYEGKPPIESETEKEVQALIADIGADNLRALVNRLSPKQ